MTVIALIWYKNGILLVSDSRATKVHNSKTNSGYKIIGHDYTQKLYRCSEDIVVAQSGFGGLDSMLKGVLSNDSSYLASHRLDIAVDYKIEAHIAKELRNEQDAAENAVKWHQGALLLGVIKLKDNTPEAFAAQIMPDFKNRELVPMVGALSGGKCLARGVPGSQIELERLMRKYYYEANNTSELEAEVLGYKLIKHMEKGSMGKFVDGPIEMFAIDSNGAKAFWIDRSKASEKGRWLYKDNMLAIDKEKEAGIKDGAALEPEVLKARERLKINGKAKRPGANKKRQSKDMSE